MACDIPAGRKTCGFLGHTANLGCSKCLKVFSGPVDKKNYSGFDRSQWPPRTGRLHRDAVDRIHTCETKARCKEVESLTGCRYSCLLDLPYFNAPRMLCIDPMHNLFLGTGKRCCLHYGLRTSCFQGRIFVEFSSLLMILLFLQT